MIRKITDADRKVLTDLGLSPRIVDVKNPRGRPRKERSEPQPKRPRGRPRKNPLPEEDS